MKSIFFLLSSFLILQGISAQTLKGLINKAKQAVEAKPGALTNDEIIAG